MTITISANDYLQFLEKYLDYLNENKDYITKLDSATGDGDHWINMHKGFNALIEGRAELESMNLQQLFHKIGMIIMSTVGGSSGVLYGGAYIDASKVLVDVESMNLKKLLEVYEAMASSIMSRGESRPGFKTMVDSLYEGIQEFSESLKDEKNDIDSLKSLKVGALKGMNATKEMEAVKGRASYRQDKGVGHLDPGAVTMYYQIEVLVDYLLSKAK